MLWLKIESSFDTYLFTLHRKLFHDGPILAFVASLIMKTNNIRIKLTCDSYGRNAMLISFKVLINLALGDLHNSLNNSSGQAAKINI